MAIKYFLVAILFVLFDVEVIFFYPYAVNFRQAGVVRFWRSITVCSIFLAGFVYIIKKGALTLGGCRRAIKTDPVLVNESHNRRRWWFVI